MYSSNADGGRDIGLELATDLDAAEVRHHHVQRSLSAGGHEDLMALLKQRVKDLDVDRLIVDHQQTAAPRAGRTFVSLALPRIARSFLSILPRGYTVLGVTGSRRRAGVPRSDVTTNRTGDV
ncbi:hypothetical protein RM530_00320 [Algiphilus sp. W345]|uniref:Uncharacterized protein n=1 Tax=Banduia mediterranea TaxID=3075609 RepID=A0ABU2WD59_9GAMM|nr:hypothetical protein [Algiphilus sp. W345]MDT0495814.1 hypothetical protein [Algiphilus sp. W345]